MTTSFGLSLKNSVKTDCKQAPPTHNVTARRHFLEVSPVYGVPINSLMCQSHAARPDRQNVTLMMSSVRPCAKLSLAIQKYSEITWDGHDSELTNVRCILSCLVCTVVILRVFFALCVYCCFSFRCRTAG